MLRLPVQQVLLQEQLLLAFCRLQRMLEQPKHQW
jgi:hypothetical protein